MKKTKTVTVKATPEHTKEVEVIVCDICGIGAEGTSRHPRITKCTICRRDIHYGYDSIGKCCDYDDDNTDYPPYYCRICYDLRFKKYKDEAERIETDYYNAKDSMEERIKAESLATKRDDLIEEIKNLKV